MRNVSDRICRENRNTHFIFNNVSFFRKSCNLWDNVEKYSISGQATDDNMAHAHCVLDTYGYKHTLRTRNTYCFSTASVLARTRLNVTSYVHCLSCWSKFCQLKNSISTGEMLRPLTELCAIHICAVMIEVRSSLTPWSHLHANYIYCTWLYTVLTFLLHRV
jgi:hypothetical protein